VPGVLGLCEDHEDGESVGIIFELMLRCATRQFGERETRVTGIVSHQFVAISRALLQLQELHV